MESLLSPQEQGKRDLRKQAIAFKGSGVFVQILDRLMNHFESSMIDFEDIYYNGKIIMTRQQIKNLLLRNKAIMPMAKRLKRVENIIHEKIHPLRKKRLEKIEKFVEQGTGHELEIRQFSRLLSLKQSKPFINRIRRLTEVDYLNLYKMIFLNKGLFARLAKGLELPADIDAIITMTRENIAGGMALYEDCPALLYLKLKMEGCLIFSEIKQVVIDEAQDYDLMQYQVFKLLFKDVRYTVLGDVNQSIEKDAGTLLYDHIAGILGRRKSVKIVLNKSYRSSYEINKFTQGILGETNDFISFERHETEPMVVTKDTIDRYDKAIVEEIADSLKKGYESIAVICKTAAEAKTVHARLKNKINIALVNSSSDEIEKGAIVITSYLAKGLEFDVVLVSDVSSENYSSEIDKKLLYVICTRALHRLTLFYRGEKSAFLCFEKSLALPQQ
jgi:DNA helicase-2/ATP-dependent DNA helicase PcrA